MKKIDVLIAVVAALAASLAIIWYAEPRWVSNLKHATNEWRAHEKTPTEIRAPLGV